MKSYNLTIIINKSINILKSFISSLQIINIKLLTKRKGYIKIYLINIALQRVSKKRPA